MNRAYLLDLAERILRTFVQAFAGALAGSELGAGWSAWNSAAIAGLAAVAALISGILSKPIGAPDTASVLPAEPAPLVVQIPDPPDRAGQPVVVED